ncbi:hypothetical protein HHK36_010621 [Tetracentron sinense]|uniref:Bulb-type lectin domain-containing protein n=1 Tax=Tetracentron sinense TaxID=13715 RepID=A0A834ZAS2_TETSI|nr:hypothetical protein HHK36_010621 [Tetracentron sinense]
MTPLYLVGSTHSLIESRNLLPSLSSASNLAGKTKAPEISACLKIKDSGNKSEVEVVVHMDLYLLVFFICLFSICDHCKSDVPVGFRVTLPVPSEFNMGFLGRAFLMETAQIVPNLKAALSVEAINGKYSCSLEVFLGDTKVWNSGHFSQFYTSERCVLELTKGGDLQLRGSRERIGWRTGTSGQGVERLQLLGTGNLILSDAMNRVKWQSFNFPADVMLLGQRIDVSTRLTSFSGNPTSFYSFEIQKDKIALYLNSGNLKYSYWEFRPSKSRNIVFAELGSTGLELFNGRHRKIAQLSSQRYEPLRFLALGNKTGNLELYYYSPNEGKFVASFQAFNTTCDLPLACKPYAICTFSNTCSCIQFSRRASHLGSDCNGFSRGFCGGGQVEMVELEGVVSILRGIQTINVSKEECVNLCIDHCTCVSALYYAGGSPASQQECFLYGLVSGVKQIDNVPGLSYLIKVPKGIGVDHGKTASARKWLLTMGWVVDGLVILLVLGGFGYYFFVIRKRRKNLPGSDNT